jgi:uncharacterized delta-60 repeat protein
MHMLQSLENRRLFAGGVDPSFGSAQGAVFDPSGELFIRDTAVDRFGRMVFAGLQYRDDEDAQDLYLSRFTADGEFDPTFGDAGTVRTTLGGVSRLEQVVARKGGGYVAVGLVIAGGTRLIAFDESGNLDRAYGTKGIVKLDNLQDVKLLQQSDGKLIVVGMDKARVNPRDDQNISYARRYLTSGQLDTTWGEKGEVNLGLRADGRATVDLPAISNLITSATLDGSDRLLLTFTNIETVRHSVTNDIVKLATRTYQRRFGGTGVVDPKFVGRAINRDSSDSDVSSVTVLTAVSVVRPDGQVAVLARNRNEPDFDIQLSLRGSKGQLTSSNAPTNGIVPELFVVENLVDGALAATADNKLIVAGVIVEGSVKTPALMQFDANMNRDVTFGTNGIMRLPASADGYQPSNLTVNPDSTLNVYVSDPPETPRSDDRRAIRVFQDDRPVASLRGVSRKGERIRLQVSVRGLDPITPGGLGADDFRIRSVGPGGGGVPSSILIADADNDDLLLSLGVNRPRGTYDVVTLNRSVSDDDGDFVHAGSFATVTI